MFLKIMIFTIIFTFFCLFCLIAYDIYKGAMADANKDWEERNNENNKI